MKRYATPAWILIAGVAIVALGYFLARIASESFRDAALANLFATVLGVIVGVPIAIEVSRLQEQERLKRSQRESDKAERERAVALYHRLRDELIHNGHTLDRIRAAIDESPHSRTDHWQWVLSIIDGLSLDAWRDFTSQPPRPAYPWELDDAVRLAYDMLQGVATRAREAAAAHTFYLGYRADDASADKYLGYVRDLSREADRRVEEAITISIRYARLYPKPKSED
jgi:hypothetical protein